MSGTSGGEQAFDVGIAHGLPVLAVATAGQSLCFGWACEGPGERFFGQNIQVNGAGRRKLASPRCHEDSATSSWVYWRSRASSSSRSEERRVGKECRCRWLAVILDN